MNGHNYRDPILALYLRGNGGVLTAVAKLCMSDQFPRSHECKAGRENLNGFIEL